MPGGDTYGNITQEHRQAIELMAQAQSATTETQANALISQAMSAAQQSGTNAATVFAAVVAHAQTIQADLVSKRTVPDTPQNNNTTTTSGASYNYSPPAVPVNFWSSTTTYKPPTGVKQATPDIIVFDQSTIDIEYLINDYFEEFGGHELIKISRADLIDGKEVAYNPIRNLSVLNQKYNPNTVIAIAPFQQNLSLYAIDLILRGIHEPYIDRENGNLVIEIDNVKGSESIEVEIAIGGTMNRVIYDY